jgi:hypothetical protein
MRCPECNDGFKPKVYFQKFCKEECRILFNNRKNNNKRYKSHDSYKIKKKMCSIKGCKEKSSGISNGAFLCKHHWELRNIKATEKSWLTNLAIPQKT